MYPGAGVKLPCGTAEQDSLLIGSYRGDDAVLLHHTFGHVGIEAGHEQYIHIGDGADKTLGLLQPGYRHQIDAALMEQPGDRDIPQPISVSLQHRDDLGFARCLYKGAEVI